LLGTWIRKRLEEHTFEDAEDDSVRADACGKSDERDGGEERSAAEAAENLSELIVQHLFSSRGRALPPNQR
jgi:hypothetical protein